MPATGQKEIVLFVHGIRSSAEAWKPLIGLLEKDEKVTSQFEFDCYGYGTKSFELRPDRRISTIEEAAGGLRELIDSSKFYDREITLVGHSQGGLVIQAYLYDMLKNGRGESLAPIRQVILMGTPSLGSAFLSPFRKMLTKFFSNPQERALRIFDQATTNTLGFVMDHVVRAKKGSANEWPIPFHVFFGKSDAIVTEASARGGFPADYVTPLEGDHFSIITPVDHNDTRYTEFVEALFEPTGHSSIYEIDLYETNVSVEPAIECQEFLCKYGEKERKVHSDNIGCIDRTVVFSRKNHCSELFHIKYRTRHDGFLRVTTDPPKNEASEGDIGTYDDYGVQSIFGFTPKPGKKFRSKIDVYGGFGEGQRDVHFHIGKDSYSKKRVYRMDLSGYLAAGYEICQEPKLHFHANDPGDHDLCKARGLGAQVEPTSIDGGIWTWEFSRVRQGVVDLSWDVKKT